MDGKGNKIREETTRSQEDDDEDNKILDQTVSGINNPEKWSHTPQLRLGMNHLNAISSQYSFSVDEYCRYCVVTSMEIHHLNI